MMFSSETKKISSDFDKIIGEPVFIEFGEEALKIRKSLMIISLIGIVVSFFGISIASDSTLFGIKFNNFRNDLIILFLGLINFYFFIKFCIYAIESFFYWRLRITGTSKLLALGKLETDFLLDYPVDQKNSTLYSWWVEKLEYMRAHDLQFKQLVDEIKSCEENICDRTNVRNLTTISNKISELLRGFKGALDNERVLSSLKRFDNWFAIFLQLQNIRWLVFDLLVPIFLGLVSLISICFFSVNSFGVLLFLI